MRENRLKSNVEKREGKSEARKMTQRRHKTILYVMQKGECGIER